MAFIHFCCLTLIIRGWWIILVFQALFVKVVPYQCLGCIWSQRDKKDNMSPTIRVTIAQFNNITNHVIVSLLCQMTDATSSPTSSILTPTTPSQRARIIEKWIRVAQVSQKKSLKMRLYSSCDSKFLKKVCVKKWSHVPFYVRSKNNNAKHN